MTFWRPILGVIFGIRKMLHIFCFYNINLFSIEGSVYSYEIFERWGCYFHEFQCRVRVIRPLPRVGPDSWI